MSRVAEISPSTRPIIVQKYGGTSVGTTERIKNIAKRVALQVRSGQGDIAVVVSAMAGETNRLVELSRQVNPNAHSRSYDMVVSAGEQVSVGLMSAALEAEGIGAEPFLAYQAGILTDDFHARARIRSIATSKFHEAWRSGRVPVVAGFQGVTERMEITTLGRGGSDTSAVALAVALGASVCEINTDVDGVYTADPRVVPEARRIDVLDYDVALELAALGSKVLHSRCVELGAKYRMPIIVRSTFDIEELRRTKIMAFSQEAALEAPVVSGVTLDKAVAKITLQQLEPGTRAVSEVFAKIASRGINVDIIIHDRSRETGALVLGFTVPQSDLSLAVSAIEELKREKGYERMTVDTRSGLAKVSAVGLGMRSHSGVAAKAFEALTANGIDILMISTSEIKISCVVAEEQGEESTRVLHRAFFPA